MQAHLDPEYRGILIWMTDISFWIIFYYRMAYSLRKTRFKMFSIIFLEKPAQFLLGVHLPGCVSIGKGLTIYHGYGLIINGRVEIGDQATLYARICIGNRYPGDQVPKLGNNVTVGTGACILGPVNIPDNSVIPANCVVTPKTLSKVIKLDSHGVMAGTIPKGDGCLHEREMLG